LAKTGSFYREAAFKRSAQEGKRKLLKAIAAGTRRDYKSAVEILEEIVSGYEGPPEAFLYLGRALHAVKSYSRSLAAFNDYISLKPRSPEGYFFAGRTCLALGFAARAVNFFEKALRRDEGNSEFMAFLGMAQLKARHSQAAVDMLQAAVEADPENKRIYRAYLNALFIRALRLCRDENYSLGIQMLRFVLENGRDGPLLRLEMGRASRELGVLDEAAEHYSRALDFSPQDPLIRWYRASIYMDLGQNAEAIEDISIIRSLGASLPDLPWNSELVDRFMISSLLEAEQWRRAADACRDWLKKREAEPGIHAMYAEAQRNLRDYEAAENHLSRAVAIDGQSLELWYAAMLTAWEGKNLKALNRALYKAKRLGGDKDILSRFSILYESETSPDSMRVMTLLQKAIHSLGPEPELMYALGKVYLKTGLLEEAVNWFEKTLTIRVDHEEARLGLIAAWEALFNEAKTTPDGGPAPAPATDGNKGPDSAGHRLAAAYRSYLDLWPDNRAIRRDEALFLVQICEYEEAAKKLEALLAWDPANYHLRRVLAYSFRKQGKYRYAAVYLKALLKEKPGDIRLLLEYVGCIERAGRVQYAKVILEKANAYFTASSEIPTALGLLAYREGNPERTFDFLRDAASRNNKDPRPWQWMAIISQKYGDGEGAARYEREYQKILKKAVSGPKKPSTGQKKAGIRQKTKKA
jgi:tetratricopeptide (TPR) repeat protein